MLKIRSSVLDTVLLGCLTILLLCIAWVLIRIEETKLQIEMDLLNHRIQILITENRAIRKEIRVITAEKRRGAVERGVSQLRKLSLKENVVYKTISRSKIKEFLVNKLNEEYPEEEFFRAGKALKLLGLLERDDDLRSILLDLYSEQIGAFYVHKEGCVYTVEEFSASSALSQMFLAHEMTHVLQDQHFDINAIFDQEQHRDNDDILNARLALIEGDATLLTFQYYMKHPSLSIFSDLVTSGILLAQKELNSAPYYVQQNLVFPYVNGLEFITKLYERGGWNRINESYGVLPVSTEQILHLDKYLDGDEPTEVAIPVQALRETLGEEWEVFYTNVLGEFNVRVLVAKYLGVNDALIPSSGWDGDRYVVLEHAEAGQELLIWKSVWDSSADAREMYDAYREVLFKKYPSLEETGTGRNARYFSNGTVWILVMVRGRELLAIEAPDEVVLKQVAKRLS